MAIAYVVAPQANDKLGDDYKIHQSLVFMLWRGGDKRERVGRWAGLRL